MDSRYTSTFPMVATMAKNMMVATSHSITVTVFILNGRPCEIQGRHWLGLGGQGQDPLGVLLKAGLKLSGHEILAEAFLAGRSRAKLGGVGFLSG